MMHINTLVATVLLASPLFLSFSSASRAQAVRPFKPVSSVSRTVKRLPLAGPAKRVAITRPVVVAGTPRKLVIPSVSIDAPIENVGLDNGKMGVPENGQRLGWYDLGPKPGEKGNAVIAGHLNTEKGPGTFWVLNKVKRGDSIIIYDDSGNSREFIVTRTVVYDVRTAPVAEIFGSTTDYNLNLITCSGKWDNSLGHYDKRLVVYSTEISRTKGVVGVR